MEPPLPWRKTATPVRSSAPLFQQAIGAFSIFRPTYRTLTADRPAFVWTGDLSTMSSIEKIALFIDGSNLHATSKALGFDIDYRRLLGEFQSRGVLLRAFYYTTLIENQEYSSIRPLIDWLDYNGYTVVTKLTKEFVDATTGRRKVKGSMDVDLAVSAMELAKHVDQIVLFSGDGDFRSLVEALQRRGVRVTVVSTLSTQPPMVADDLRRQADVFIDLAELRQKVGRDPVDRPGSREMRQSPQFLARGAINRGDPVE
ncbi:uncharacterized LabA/DUF88 family protein [Bradyrhizobium sp. CIR48]|nr:uncharacterized LabA/DUF88 family protein [Bradyrhizobium sp. CIR48]